INLFTALFASSIPSSFAASANRRAYVGVQQTVVIPLSRIARIRAALLSPPPGTHKQPSRSADSKASQKPIKGPKENAKNTRSAADTPAARKISIQLSTIPSQLSGVSSQRNGLPVVPLV